MAGNQYNNKSFYSQTNVRDFYLDLWTDPDLPSLTSDEQMAIPPKFDKRPDLMAYDLYGDPNYWWIFAVRNKDILIDTVEDFTAGTVIAIVPKDSLLSLI